jgi:arsenate reductase
MKYREWNLTSKKLSEKDMHDLILREYSFLKRQVFVSGNTIFIGSAKANVDLLKRKLA